MFSIPAFAIPQPRPQLVQFLIVISFLLCTAGVLAQTEQLPYMNAGDNSVFAQVDFARTMADEQLWRETT
ncbi:MAG TPA: hypothetical protein VJQ54_23655, partial [Candidatus Sulfotelmatobacter sp.]|nr:hypothetical protein [Candidatus Sulfotelmatobacter sp.]